MTQTVSSTDPGLAMDPAMRPTGPIVVATDGSPGVVGALRAAAELAANDGVRVIAVAALEPAPIVVADYGIALPPVDTTDARRQALEDAVRRQLDDVLGHDHGWTVEVQEGNPATIITRVARDNSARALVVGLGHHDLMDRLTGSEVALQVLRLSRVPVLAVPREFRHMPRRVAIACDFGEGSQQAGRAAFDLFPALSMVYVVHVAPRLDVQPEALIAGIGSHEDLEPSFARFIRSLEAPQGTTIETMTLTGKPSRALLDFAKSAHLDAIVTGSRGGGFLDRIMVGSTATALIRGAECVVLGVPTTYRARIVTHMPPKVGVDEPAEASEWPARLQLFSQRNAGRIVSLEIDDPDIGAQTQVTGYPFLGASYDHQDRRVELMLGELGEPERHLSRGITDVRAVDVLRDAEGRDRALRISHGAGQTLLIIDW
jgi:nucleotide-binding universal stress UspA family protein